MEALERSKTYWRARALALLEVVRALDPHLDLRRECDRANAPMRWRRLASRLVDGRSPRKDPGET